MKQIDRIKTFAKILRKRSIELAYSTGNKGSHLGGGLSTVEIFATLYGGILNFSSTDTDFEERDRLIVSKGHCVLSYYSALEYVGFLTKKEIESFETNGSPFHGHATRNLDKGIEFSGGSLSLGVSFAVGVAIAAKKKQLNSHIYSIVGDGECNEGLVWESAMSASNFNLNNLTIIVDCNKLQYDGFTKDVLNSYSLAEKFKSFGFYVIEVDGHNCQELFDSLNFRIADKPIAIIAHTIKGKGVSFMEDKKEWHHSALSKKQYELAIKELL